MDRQCLPARTGIASSISQITQTTTRSTTISNSPTTVIATVIVTVTPTFTRDPVTSTVTRTTTAGSALPPVRPTSSGDNDDEPSTTTEAPEYCPTGFYACEASAGAGCCRTGRDCATTSCPPPSAYTTITNPDGVTVVAPAPTDAGDGGEGDDGAEPECANGWFLCPAEAGPVAGCCPDNYRCGTASCTLSEPDATATAQKQLPNAADGMRARMGSGNFQWARISAFSAAALFLVHMI